MVLINFTSVRVHRAGAHHADKATSEPGLPFLVSTYHGLGLPRPCPRLLKPPCFFYRILLIILFWEKMNQLGRKTSPASCQVSRIHHSLSRIIDHHSRGREGKQGTDSFREAPKARLPGPSLLGVGLPLGVTLGPVSGEGESSSQPAA